MARQRDIRAFDYVNHPYEAVHRVLREGAQRLFQAATNAASARAHDIASALHVQLGAVEITTHVDIRLAELEVLPATVTSPESTKLDIEWEATKAARLFPFMRATLLAYPLTATETQLELVGQYEPPLGVVGKVIDDAIGHRIAEASVHRFVGEVAGYLRDTMRD